MEQDKNQRKDTARERTERRREVWEQTIRPACLEAKETLDIRGPLADDVLYCTVCGLLRSHGPEKKNAWVVFENEGEDFLLHGRAYRFCREESQR